MPALTAACVKVPKSGFLVSPQAQEDADCPASKGPLSCHLQAQECCFAVKGCRRGLQGQWCAIAADSSRGRSHWSGFRASTCGVVLWELCQRISAGTKFNCCSTHAPGEGLQDAHGLCSLSQPHHTLSPMCTPQLRAAAAAAAAAHRALTANGGNAQYA